MNFSQKVAAALLAIVALFVFFGMFAYNAVSNLEQNIVAINAARERAGLAASAENQFSSAVLEVRRYFADHDFANRLGFYEKLEITLELEAMLLANSPDEDAAMMTNVYNKTTSYVARTRSRFFPVYDEYLAALSSGDQDRAARLQETIRTMLAEEFTPDARSIQAGLAGVSAANHDRIRNLVQNSIFNAQAGKETFFIFLMLALFTAMSIGILIARMVSRPVNSMTKSLLVMAEGNFSRPIEPALASRTDEFGTMAQAMETLNHNTASLIRTLEDRNEQLDASYHELNAAYQQLTAAEEELQAQYEELQTKEEALRTGDERFQFAIEAAQNAIWDLDLKTGDYNVSPSWNYAINLPEVATVDELLQHVHPDDLAVRRQRLAEHLAGGTHTYEVEYRLKNRDGEWIWALLRGRAIRDGSGQAVRIVGSMANITELKQREQEIQHLANHDHLTGLLNRRGFKELAAPLLRFAEDGRRYFFLMIDLDDFKLINDVHGHTAGDEVLIEFTQALTVIFGENAIVARQGGDEFLICWPANDDRSILEQAANMLSGYRITTEYGVFEASVSGGIASYPEHGSDIDILIQKADLALNNSKQAGKRRIQFYEETMQNQFMRYVALREGLGKALPQREFMLYYQPIYDIQHEDTPVIGFEALLRWQSPELGWVSPAEFIPIAEQTELIISIGAWVLEEACLFSSRIQETVGEYANVSVNVSVRQLLEPRYVQAVRAIVTKLGIPPQFIHLEITESAMMTDAEHCIKQLAKLRAMGFHIALDDFGTGYSSLIYLKKMPLTALKIDKSFIDDIDRPGAAQGLLLRNIIRMAKQMHCRVVAEGVETPSQLSFLQASGCDYCQGYLFNKPLPEDKAFELATRP